MSRRHSTSVQPDPIRKELLSISDRQALVQATATTAELAPANQKAEQDTEMSVVLRRYGSDALITQMEKLTTVIEQHGGKTELSDVKADDDENYEDEDNEQ